MSSVSAVTGRIRVGTATTLKTSLHQSLQFAAYHHHLGVDEVIMFFDDPEDLAAATLHGKPGITVIKCDSDHWNLLNHTRGRPETVQERQITNMNWLIQERAVDLDWIIHIDSDELIWAPDGLHRTLQNEGSKTSVLQLTTMEAVPPHPDLSDPFKEVTLFREHLPHRYPLAKRLHVGSGFIDSEGFFRGHTQGKPAVRLDGVVTAVKIHRAVEMDKSRFTKKISEGMRVLHYDAGSFDQWLAKWRDRAGFARDRHSKGRRAQWDEFARLDRAGDEPGLRRLYKGYYMLPKREVPILRAMGLLRRVRLDPDWFDWDA